MAAIPSFVCLRLIAFFRLEHGVRLFHLPHGDVFANPEVVRDKHARNRPIGVRRQLIRASTPKTSSAVFLVTVACGGRRRGRWSAGAGGCRLHGDWALSGRGLAAENTGHGHKHHWLRKPHRLYLRIESSFRAFRNANRGASNASWPLDRAACDCPPERAASA